MFSRVHSLPRARDRQGSSSYSILGYGCWYHVLGRYEVNRAAPYLLLLPIASVAGGVVFLGEAPTALILLGGAAVIGGVALIVVERAPVATQTPPAD